MAEKTLSELRVEVRAILKRNHGKMRTRDRAWIESFRDTILKSGLGHAVAAKKIGVDKWQVDYLCQRALRNGKKESVPEPHRRRRRKKKKIKLREVARIEARPRIEIAMPDGVKIYTESEESAARIVRGLRVS